MKSLYNRIDTYLLSHWPLLWHSKILYLLISGLLINGIFFCWGWAVASLSLIKERDISRIYENGAPIFVHVILCLILITLWAIQFYKKNAIKNLYPLSKFYLTGLFLFLTLGFTAFITPAESFNYGLRKAVRSLVDLKTLQNDVDLYNKAAVFLPNGESEYTLDKRAYPKPFPIQFMEYDLNTNEWDHVEAEYKGVFYDPDNHPENNDTLNGMIVQCYEGHSNPLEEDCEYSDYYEVIDRFVDLPKDSTIAYRSLYNYSDYAYNPYVLRQSKRLVYGMDFDLKYEDYSNDQPTPSFLPEVHRLMDQRDKLGIEKVITDVAKVFDRYGIRNKLPAENISEYLLTHRFQLPEYYLIDDNYDVNDSYLVSSNQELKMEMNVKTSEETNSSLILGAYAKSDFHSLIENTAEAYFYDPMPYLFWIILIIAACLSVFFMIFEFTSILAFAISIPISGAIVILNVLIAVLLNPSIHHELAGIRFISTILMINASVFLLLGIWSTRSGISKKISNIAVLLGYFIVPFLPLISLFFLDGIFSYTKNSACNEYSFDTVHSLFFYFIRPDVCLIAGIIALALYFRVVRRYHAKAE